MALGPAEGISRAQQKHIEGSGTLQRGGRASRSSQNTGPRRVFLTSREAQSRHGHGQRAGWWEGADLGVAAHARRSRYRLEEEARYLLLRQRYAKSVELDKRASMARERAWGLFRMMLHEHCSLPRQFGRAV